MKNKRQIYSFFKIYDKCKHEKLKFKYHILFVQFAKFACLLILNYSGTKSYKLTMMQSFQVKQFFKNLHLL